jgi:ATP-dependent RNA helicase DeaD
MAATTRPIFWCRRKRAGKTVAFGIAIATTLLGSAERFEAAERPLGLVIAPTRELAIQVQRELDWLYAAAGARPQAASAAWTCARNAVRWSAARISSSARRGGCGIISPKAHWTLALRADGAGRGRRDAGPRFREDLEFILGAAPPNGAHCCFPRPCRVASRNSPKPSRKMRCASRRPPPAAHADIEYQLMLVRRDEREHAVINTLLDSDSTSAGVLPYARSRCAT